MRYSVVRCYRERLARLYTMTRTQFVYSSSNVARNKADEKEPGVIKAQLIYQVSGTSESERLVFITIC